MVTDRRPPRRRSPASGRAILELIVGHRELVFDYGESVETGVGGLEGLPQLPAVLAWLAAW